LTFISSTIFFPIYPDEIQSRFWLSRILSDLPVRISGLPTCTSTFEQFFPVLLYIPALINAFLHGLIADHLTLRIVGIAVCLCWVSLFIIHLYKSCAGPKNNIYLFCIFIISLLNIGVMPFFLVTNRAEQLYLPLIFITIIITKKVSSFKAYPKILINSIYIFIYYVLISTFLYSHAKSFLYTPFFIYAIFLFFVIYNKSFCSFFISLALLILTAISSYSSFKFALSCPDNPAIANSLGGYFLNPIDAFVDFPKFISDSYSSLLNFPTYASKLGFIDNYDANYLPNINFIINPQFLNFFINIIFFVILISIPFLLFYKFKSDIYRNILYFLLYLSILINGIFNITKNWYDSAFFYGLIVLLFSLIISKSYSVFLNHRFFSFVSFPIAVSIFSGVLLITDFIPQFYNGFSGPGISIFNNIGSNNYSSINRVANKCKIDLKSSSRLIVDDLTYLNLSKTKSPLGITYLYMAVDTPNLIKMFNDPQLPNVGQDHFSVFLSRLNSDGLITRCASIPTFYRDKSQFDGIFCCMSKDDLIKLN
jgi:hypothetical protein